MNDIIWELNVVVIITCNCNGNYNSQKKALK